MARHPDARFMEIIESLNEEVLLERLQERHSFGLEGGEDFLDDVKESLEFTDPKRYNAVIDTLKQLANDQLTDEAADNNMKKLFIRNWDLYSSFSLVFLPKIKESQAYLEFIEEKYKDAPEVFDNYLGIFEKYQRQEIDILGCYNEVAVLFKDSPDDFEFFKQHLPLGADLRLSKGEGFSPFNPLRCARKSRKRKRL